MLTEGVRRSSRIPKEIAILLVGSDMEGKVFSEPAKTVLLSRHGAGIVSKNVLSAEQELILRRLDTNKEAEVRVVGQLGAHGESHTYGVAFLNPEVDLWEIQFPPMTESERKESRVLLQCSGCKNCETVQHSDLESDVYLVTKGSSDFARARVRAGARTQTCGARGKQAEARSSQNEFQGVHTELYVWRRYRYLRRRLARGAVFQKPKAIPCSERDRSSGSPLSGRARHFCPRADCPRRGIEAGKTVPLRRPLRQELNVPRPRRTETSRSSRIPFPISTNARNRMVWERVRASG